MADSEKERDNSNDLKKVEDDRIGEAIDDENSPPSEAAATRENEMEGTIAMNFHVPPDTDKISHRVSPDWTVAQLKQRLHEKVQNIPVEQMRLVYKGGVLDNTKTLEFYNPREGGDVFVMRTGTSAASEPPPTAAAHSNSTTTAVNPMMNMENMRSTLMRNPDVFANLTQDPMVKSMMDNPEFMRAIMDCNPQLQQLREQVPELNQILNDPQLIQQTIDMVRNPNLLREVMRNNDRAMSNIDAIPGGFNALRRMYHNIQEPMWEATVEGNTRMAHSNEEREYCLDTDSGPNREPLPNPWAPAAPSQPQGGNMDIGGLDPAMSMASLVGRMSNAQTGSGANFRPQANRRWGAAGTTVPTLQSRLAQSRSTETTAMNSASATSVTGAASNAPGSLFGGQLPPPTLGSQPATQQQPSLTDSLQSLSLQANGVGASTPIQSTNDQSVQRATLEQQFSDQLSQLRDMGFDNTDACIQALQAAHGNVNRAVELLLGNL